MGFAATLTTLAEQPYAMGGTSILSAEGTVTKTFRIRRRAAGAFLVISLALLAPLQPAFAEDGPVLPDPALTEVPVPSPGLPTETPAAPTEEPVPTEEPAQAPVPAAPSEPSSEPAAPPAVPVEVVPVAPAPVIPAPAEPAPAEELAVTSTPEEPAASEAAVVTPPEAATAAVVLPSPSASATPTEEQSQASPVQAVVAVATGSPLGVQLLTVALLLAAGFAYFRVLGSKGMRTPSRSAK